MAEGFCTLCGKDIDDFDNLEECPHCHTQSIPCSYDRQETININVHELRVLCIWAENYANTNPGVDVNVVYAIAARLRKQLPGPVVCLTMADEFLQLREAGYDYETNHPSDPL